MNEGGAGRADVGVCVVAYRFFYSDLLIQSVSLMFDSSIANSRKFEWCLETKTTYNTGISTIRQHDRSFANYAGW